MKKRFVFLMMTGFMFIAACHCPRQCQTSDSVKNQELLMATLYFQRAAENRALYYQAFNIARERIITATTSWNGTKKLAVVVDIDETVLDNSPWEAKSILEGFSYPDKWQEWTNMGVADPTAGAVDFLNFATSKGVEVFYITNRKTDEKEGTLKNLIEKGFPCADEAHLLLRVAESNKEARRQTVSQHYEIILLMGDNLNDLSDVFEKANPENRDQLTDSLKSEFGRRFIVLPNPMYGDWESALLKYQYNFTAAQKDSIRKAALRPF
ncbi:MAG: 5'-nucleotidase, lipoprotein e(P4) family [Bacteroidales bacterium]|nr:5'-nucleotidase, lipoprotein e(P4) family [Bacteroidales bacterium]